MNETYSILSRPYYNSTKQCYINVLTLDRIPPSNAIINKIINYEFESGTPTNWGWYLAIGWALLDGTSSVTPTNMSMEYVVDCQFEDA